MKRCPLPTVYPVVDSVSEFTTGYTLLYAFSRYILLGGMSGRRTSDPFFSLGVWVFLRRPDFDCCPLCQRAGPVFMGLDQAGRLFFSYLHMDAGDDYKTRRSAAQPGPAGAGSGRRTVCLFYTCAHSDTPIWSAHADCWHQCAVLTTAQLEPLLEKHVFCPGLVGYSCFHKKVRIFFAEVVE